jgi:esterase/lipase superfamily enzyme
LDRLAKRISIYYSANDAVLQLSMAVNLGAKRLGQEGPHDRFDTTQFPPAIYRMTDCAGFRDYDFNPGSSHQYYRRSPLARAEIASAMASA